MMTQLCSFNYLIFLQKHTLKFQKIIYDTFKVSLYSHWPLTTEGVYDVEAEDQAERWSLGTPSSIWHCWHGQRCLLQRP